jgi:hypothetical protein
VLAGAGIPDGGAEGPGADGLDGCGALTLAAALMALAAALMAL